MENIITRREKNSGLMALYYLFIGLILVAQAVCLLLFVVGLTPVFGTTVTIPSAVELIFGVLYMNGNWYRGLFGAFIGVMFFVFIGLMIKNLVTSFPLIKKMSNDSILSSPGAKNIVLTYGVKAGESCGYAVIFAMMCASVDDIAFSNSLYAIGIIWFASILITRIFYSMIERYTPVSILTKLLYDFISIGSLLMLAFFAKYPAVDRFIFSVKSITVNFGQSLVGMIMPIIYFVIAALALKAMFDATSSVHVQNYNLRYFGKILVGFSIALGIGAIVLFIAGGYSSRLDFEAIVYMFKPYLAFILLSVSALISSYFPTEYNKYSLDEGNETKYEINEDGVLCIYGHITEIQPYAFENRIDIKKIYIPQSVMVIGENAFAGCSHVSEIHCEHPAVPAYWSPLWKDGCSAPVFWKPSENVYQEPANQPPTYNYNY